MPKKRNPGCLCCGGCPIFDDNFDRADSGTIGNGWTENAGVWDISSNKLVLSSSKTNARITQSLTAPASDSVRFAGKMSSSSSGDLLRLHLTTTSYVQLKVGTGAQVTVGGTFSPVTINVTAAISTEHTLEAWLCNATSPTLTAGSGNRRKLIGCVLVLNGAVIGWTVGPSLQPTYNPGFGTGGTAAGTISFDDFSIVEYEGANEKQRIAITGSPTGGNFTLTTVEGTTGNIAYNASAATVQTALEAVVGSGNVVCTGGPLPGSAVTVEFQASLSQQDRADMTSTNSLTGGTSPTITITNLADGHVCPVCLICRLNFDLTYGYSQLKLVVAGYTGGDTSMNGTFYLDRIGNPCTDSSPATTSECIEPCQCYELSVSLSQGGNAIDKIRAYVRCTASVDMGSACVEWIDTGAGAVRVTGQATGSTGTAGATDALSLPIFPFGTSANLGPP